MIPIDKTAVEVARKTQSTSIDESYATYVVFIERKEKLNILPIAKSITASNSLFMHFLEQSFIILSL